MCGRVRNGGAEFIDGRAAIAKAVVHAAEVEMRECVARIKAGGPGKDVARLLHVLQLVERGAEVDVGFHPLGR